MIRTQKEVYMVRIDTLKVRANRKALKSYDKSLFKTNIDDERGTSLVLRYWVKKPIGLNMITIYDDYFQLEISAKILLDCYFDLINKDTIELVVVNLNKTNLINIDLKSFLETAQVLKVHLTNNLIMLNPIDDYILTLADFKAYNLKYSKMAYPDGGIVFTKGRKRIIERMTFYDKYKTAKTDAQLIKIVDIDSFRNCLRIEQNITSFIKMREYFNLKPDSKIIKLSDILENDSNPNLVLASKILNPETLETNPYKCNTVQEYCTLNPKISLNQIYLLTGRSTFAEHFNNDLGFIKIFVKNKTSSDITYYREMKKIKDIIKFPSNSGYREKEKMLIAEIIDKLKKE